MENHDINVAEHANLPKFSKLDHKETHLRPLELFFDNALVHIIVDYSKLYSDRGYRVMKHFAHS